ncbi:hypothetical protein CG018_07585 [Gemella sp. ND 6198]|uniref:hypothetical protein n=1 Tax=Gemella sp. ND 6198 TaxID=2040624 RepID=UPI000E0A3231|nr:hypothetical protein [Gemella sp. ND 6198]AXI27273.1 hypothetical protein CG018_07585 [Gemella sp. ND 6198]
MTEQDKQKMREIRNIKDRERYANSEELRREKQYKNKKNTARAYLTRHIREEDKEEFRNILKKL